ncbi:hypothetical protein HALLA_13370 [Halostagnicola larsenii XH-48]|uniref:O-antigen ligase-related domain-containing protein n=2 Tax=Halostagnicola larsenii TaxID=353800 RepID=W0JUL2_9EURY|nr:hypothetical protein HALLA_13370 [Halostagnicola larsenii XH-48]
MVIYFAITNMSDSNFMNGRLILFFDNPNVFALHIAPATVLGAYIAYSKWKQDRIQPMVLTGAIAIIGIALIVLSQSRRVFIYLFISIFLIVGTSFGRRDRILNLAVKGGVIALSFGVLGILLLASGFVPDIFIERLNVLDGRGSLDNRIIPIILGFRFLKENLIFGAGYNNFMNHLDYLAITPLEKRYAHKPHNMFIIPFVEGGIFAGFGISALTGIISWRSVRSWKSGLFEYSEIAFVFVVCTFSFFASQMFGVFSLLRLNWLMMFLCLISLNIVADRGQSPEQAGEV